MENEVNNYTSSYTTSADIAKKNANTCGVSKQSKIYDCDTQQSCGTFAEKSNIFRSSNGEMCVCSVGDIRSKYQSSISVNSIRQNESAVLENNVSIQSHYLSSLNPYLKIY